MNLVSETIFFCDIIVRVTKVESSRNLGKNLRATIVFAHAQKIFGKKDE